MYAYILQTNRKTESKSNIWRKEIVLFEFKSLEIQKIVAETILHSEITTKMYH